MKFLLDKVAIGSIEWRILADTRNTTALVVCGEKAYEFATRHAAFTYVADKYRRAADLRNLQPGQSYSLPMSDGTTKTVQVQNNTPQGVNLMDPASGEVMTIPHLQTGAEPSPAQNQKPKTPGSPGGPTPTPNNGQQGYGDQDGVSPENVTSALCADDLIRVTASELGREPYNCKHDGGYLYRKEPSAPEKYCAQCGMVYAAENTAEEMERTAVITGGPGSYHVKSEEGKNLGGPYKTREQAEHRLKQVEYFKHKGATGKCKSCGERTANPDDLCPFCHDRQRTKRLKELRETNPKKAGCDSDYFVEGFDTCDCEVHRKDKKAKIISEESECSNCGSHGDLDDRGLCKKCRRKAMFRAWKNKERIVTAFDVIAQPAPMPGQQAMPSAETSNMGETLKMDEKSPGDFAEEPETQSGSPNPNAKRQLTPHEIIEEAESLIRNALVKGVKIGADELSEYMGTYYSNGVQELMQGIALAWQKVQYEEGMEKGTGDPNAPQGEGFGPKPPTTPEEAAQMAPKNGPIQTHRLS